MSRLLETIRIENGAALHLEWHERRMANAIRERWQLHAAVELRPLIHVPAEFSTGTFRCNIRYGPEIRDISFAPYEKRIIRSLKLVDGGAIDYHLKYDDRRQLEALLAMRGECDEILIVRDGFITDTSMSNVIFTDGHRWVTPANPLLKGTCRDRLIGEGMLSEMFITPAALPGFTGCRLINAMRDPAEEPTIPVSQIFH
jgi:4-amino-4-deoxychorismate lyase